MTAVEEYRMEVASRGLHPVANDGSVLALADAALSEMEAALAERDGELDKWRWIARDACEALAYETHVNPRSPLDYRLACWAKGITP